VFSIIIERVYSQPGNLPNISAYRATVIRWLMLERRQNLHDAAMT
jgi:predicted DNA-binding ribbon-helix-helix protein